jgi:hypothetical protein
VFNLADWSMIWTMHSVPQVIVMCESSPVYIAKSGDAVSDPSVLECTEKITFMVTIKALRQQTVTYL